MATHNDRIPRAVKVEPIPVGDRLRVKIPAGGRTSELAEQAEVIAACLEARELRIVRDQDNARYASVTIVRRDPLAGPGVLAWPYRDAARLSVWAPIPVGVDEDGQWVAVSLPERNVLVGGEPGAGKSVALSLLVATAALDPDAVLVTLDGKLVELACWGGVAARTVGVDVDDAIRVLIGLRTELDLRLRVLLRANRRKIRPDFGMPLIVVVIDELAHYLNGPDRKQNAEFANLLRDLVSRGRAVGIVVLAATQKPSTDVIPSAIRDLFGFRWAFRCTTPQASDTILGQGWASLGQTASTIDPAARGVGLLLAEGGQPVRMRACYLDDDDLVGLAERGAELRAGEPDAHFVEWLGVEPPGPKATGTDE
jgi:DNA segregation ATPase FtsK/SpoIIIE-like protein